MSEIDQLIEIVQITIDTAVQKNQLESIYSLRTELYQQYSINHSTLQVLFLWACFSGNLEDVNWFLANGLDPNQVKLFQLQSTYHLTNKIPATPLLLACIEGDEHEDVIQLLLSKLNFDAIKESIINYLDLYKTFSLHVLQIIFNLLADKDSIRLANELLPNTYSLQQLELLIANGATLAPNLLSKMYVYKSILTLENILQNFPQLNFQDNKIKTLLGDIKPLNFIANYYNIEVLDEAKLLIIFELLKKHNLDFNIDKSIQAIFLKKLATTKLSREANKNSLKLLEFLENAGISFSEITQLPLVQKYYLSKLLLIFQQAFKDPSNVLSTLPANIIAYHILPHLFAIEFYDAKTRDQKTLYPQVSLQKVTHFLSFRPKLLADTTKSSQTVMNPISVEHLHALRT